MKNKLFAAGLTCAFVIFGMLQSPMTFTARAEGDGTADDAYVQLTEGVTASALLQEDPVQLFTFMPGFTDYHTVTVSNVLGEVTVSVFELDSGEAVDSITLSDNEEDGSMEIMLQAGVSYLIMAETEDMPAGADLMVSRMTPLSVSAVQETQRGQKGDTLTLAVELDGEEDIPSLAYSWYRLDENNERQEIEGEHQSELIVTVDSAHAGYVCEAASGLRTASVNFTVEGYILSYARADSTASVLDVHVGEELVYVIDTDAKIDTDTNTAEDARIEWFVTPPELGGTSAPMAYATASVSRTADYPIFKTVYAMVTDPWTEESYRVDFDVTIDNALIAWPEGGEPGKTVTRTVPYNHSVIESVEVSAYDTSEISYQWYMDGTLLDGENSSDFPAEYEDMPDYAKITHECSLTCEVKDQFGGSSEAVFAYNIDNELRAKPKGGKEGESLYLTPDLYSSLSLETVAEARDLTGLTCHWYKNGEAVEGETQLTMEVSRAETADYSCAVNDQYGNTAYALFSVRPTNRLDLRSEIPNPGEVNVKPGDEKELTVLVQAIDPALVSLQWYLDDELIEGATEDSFTLTMDSSAQEGDLFVYECRAADTLGGSSSFSFDVYTGEEEISEEPVFVTDELDAKTWTVTPEDYSYVAGAEVAENTLTFSVENTADVKDLEKVTITFANDADENYDTVFTLELTPDEENAGWLSGTLEIDSADYAGSYTATSLTGEGAKTYGETSPAQLMDYTFTILPTSAPVTDQEAPVLVSIETDTSEEVTINDTVTVSAVITDNDTGVDSAYAVYVSENGDVSKTVVLEAEDENDESVFTGRFTVEEFTLSGAWKVASVNVKDRAGNEAVYYNTLLFENEALVLDMSSADVYVGDTTTDTIAPEIMEVSVQARQNEENKWIVSASAVVEDNESGVAEVWMDYSANDNSGTFSLQLKPSTEEENLFILEEDVSEYVSDSRGVVFQVAQIYVVDGCGNIDYLYNSALSTEEPATDLSGGDIAIDYWQATQVIDATSVLASPKIVSPGENVTITVDISEEFKTQSGYVEVFNDDSGQSYSIPLEHTASESSFVSTFAIEDGIENGSWKVKTVCVFNSLDQEVSIYNQAYTDTEGNAGFTDLSGGDFEITNSLEDHVAPELISVEAFPARVKSGEAISIKAQVKDANIDNCFVRCEFDFEGHEKRGHITETLIHDAESNTYIVSFVLPEEASGTLLLDNLYVSDSWGNSCTYLNNIRHTELSGEGNKQLADFSGAQVVVEKNITEEENDSEGPSQQEAEAGNQSQQGAEADNQSQQKAETGNQPQHEPSGSGTRQKETEPSKMDPEGNENDPASVAGAEKAVKALSDDKTEPKGSKFSKIQLRSTKQKKDSITIKWNKVSGASGYLVYGSLCGRGKTVRRLVKISGTSYTQKKLKRGTYYQYIVLAYKTVENQQKVIASSKRIHVATKGGKVTNVSKLKVTYKKKTANALKIGKKLKLKVKVVKQSKKLKLKKHRKIRFESSNPKIATVSSQGVVKGKKRGKCYIYIYSQNGTYKKIKVTVK